MDKQMVGRNRAETGQQQRRQSPAIDMNWIIESMQQVDVGPCMEQMQMQVGKVRDERVIITP